MDSMGQVKLGGTTPVAVGNGYVISRDLNPRLVSVAGLKPLGRETRKHPPEQVRKLAASLKEFGFVFPVLTGRDGRVVAGWAVVLAARQLSIDKVPAVSLTDRAASSAARPQSAY
jgi:ParB-like chromosome segregation protein Spo0J